MGEDAVWDTEKGELRILGQRYTAIDAQTLCNHLDALVGMQVAEVIMHNLEYRQGKLDAARLRSKKPQATLHELVEYLAKTDRLSGFGVTNVTLPENQQGPVEVGVSNPSVKGSVGAAKAFAFSWWAGALSTLLDKEMEANHIFYNEEKNMMTCQILPRQGLTC